MAKKKKEDTAGAESPASVQKLSQADLMLEAMQDIYSTEGLIQKGEAHKMYTGAGLSWGIPSLNYICTQNPFIGIVPGRIYEIYGPYSSGKTTLVLHALAECLKIHGVAAFVDAEHALDPVYAKNLGVDMSKLLITQPDYGEQALDIVDTFVRKGIPMIVVDSVAALVPKAELDASNDKTHIGLQARMMSQALRKLTPVVAKSQTSLLFINQTRKMIGVMFGDPTTTSAGDALKFYSSVRLEVFLSTAKTKAITGNYKMLTGKQDDARLGSEMSVKAVKNKLAPPFQDTVLNIIYGKGVDKIHDLFDFALKNELITRGRGAYRLMQNGKEMRIVDSAIDDYTSLIWELLREKYKK